MNDAEKWGEASLCVRTARLAHQVERVTCNPKAAGLTTAPRRIFVRVSNLLGELALRFCSFEVFAEVFEWMKRQLYKYTEGSQN